jgi:hypothetical protein
MNFLEMQNPYTYRAFIICTSFSSLSVMSRLFPFILRIWNLTNIIVYFFLKCDIPPLSKVII